MRERDSGRALKRWIARKKAEDGTWDDKVPIHPEVEHWTCKDALREDLKAQLREESGPSDRTVTRKQQCDALVAKAQDQEAVPIPKTLWDEPTSSPWGCLLAILAGLAAWGALIVLGMCLWAAVKHG